MEPLVITLVGPGRAGMALALAATTAGHRIASVVARERGSAAEAAAALGAAPYAIDERFEGTGLLVIAVRDAAIADVAARLAPSAGGYEAAVHLSGFTSLDALEPLAAAGVPTGSFHPLQTLPTAEVGAARLAGAWIAITADEPLRSSLEQFAASLGALSFDLRDDAKSLYHAAAAASANFPLAALTMASDLFDAAGVPFAAARPLVEAVVANAFELGPRASLTGPVARGDVSTVAGQLLAVGEESPEWVRGFMAFVAELARISGRSAQFDELTEG